MISSSENKRQIPLNHWLVISAIIAIVFVVLVYISQVVFYNYPFCLDEYNYLYQAKIFSSGQSYLNINPKAVAFVEKYMLVVNDRLFTKYPPGFPLMLFFGDKFGIAGLINPLISLGTLIIIYLIGVEIVGSLFSILGVLLVASNSYFLAYAGSYFSQPAALFLTSLTVFIYLKFKSANNAKFLFLAAFVLCLAFVVRPLDAFCLWVVLFLNIVFSKLGNKVKLLIIFCCLFSLGAISLIFYNKTLTGNFGITPYPVWDSDFKVFYFKEHNLSTVFMQMGIFIKVYLLNLKRSFWPLLSVHFLPYLYCWIPLIVLGFWGRDKKRLFWLDWVCIAYCVILVALYNVHPITSSKTPGWPQYGARYWYVLIAPIAVFLFQGIKMLHRFVILRTGVLLIVFLIFWQIYVAIGNFQSYSTRFRFIQNVQADIRKHCPEKSIVVLSQTEGGGKLGELFVNLSDLKRNPFLNGPRLYLLSNAGLDSILNLYPEYSVCNYYFDKLEYKIENNRIIQ